MLNETLFTEKIVSKQLGEIRTWNDPFAETISGDDILNMSVGALSWRVQELLLGPCSYLGLAFYEVSDMKTIDAIRIIVSKANDPFFLRTTDPTIKVKHALIEERGVEFRSDRWHCTRQHAYEYIGDDGAELIDQYTGELIEPGTLILRYKEGVTNLDNITNSPSDWYVCECCGELFNSEIDEPTNTQDGNVCGNCIDEYSVCDCCNTFVRTDNLETIYRNSWSRNIAAHYCHDCANEEAQYCTCCGDYYLDDEITEVGYDDYVCESCFDENYTTCEDCGEVIRRDDACWIDDEPYCDSCADDHRNPRAISSYHTHHHSHLETYGDDIKKMGTETEVECAGASYEDLNNTAIEVTEMMDDHVFCERDGSLINGFEIITKPHTPEEFYKLPLKEVFDKLVGEGYTSHNNGRCGLHIHFSNEWFGDDFEEIDDNVSKVVHFYSENYDTMVALSRRKPSQLGWARKFPVKDFDESKMIKSNSVGHDVAVNLQNMRTIHTVEFRLGRGTLKYESYMAWVDMHIAIVKNSRIVEKNDTDLNHWLKGINEETKAYIKERTGIEIVDEEREVA